MALTTISRFIKVIVSWNIFSKTWLQFMCASSHHVCSHWFQTQVIDDRHLNYINEFCALAWIAWKRKHTGAQIFWNTILLPILLIHTYTEREREREREHKQKMISVTHDHRPRHQTFFVMMKTMRCNNDLWFKNMS